nr:hypothetical protein MACL_00000036 [Theileria orientalis]
MTSSDIPGLPRYKKFSFTTPEKHNFDTVYMDHTRIQVDPGVFSSATIYTWFDKPMLIIINTVETQNDEEVTKYQYFTDDDKSYKSYVKFTVEFDVQDNPEEMKKLLKNINRNMKRLLTIDIGNDLGDESTYSTSLDDHKNLKMTKGYMIHKPFVELRMEINQGLFNDYFQIEELTHNQNVLKVDIPLVQVNRFIVYFWNSNPIMLAFVSKNKHHYYIQKTSDEWIPLLDDFGVASNTEMSDERIEKRLKFTILQKFDAFFIDVTNTEDYDFAGKEISVVRDEADPLNKGMRQVYKHSVDTGAFKLGACFQDSIYMDMVPIGKDVEHVTVYMEREIPFMVKLAVVENDVKRDVYVSREIGLRWKLNKNPKKLLDELDKPIFGFGGLFPDTIRLDIGKKSSYECRPEYRSSKCSEISVKLFDEYGPYKIYLHEPVHSGGGAGEDNGSFRFTSLTSNGAKIFGVVPGDISKMRVYFLDDLVPVGIEIISNTTDNYVNNGNNRWVPYKGETGKYMLDPFLFQNCSRESNTFVAFDIGHKVLHFNGEGEALTTTTRYGTFIEHTLQLKAYRQFIFDGLAYKGFWYRFDAAALFLEKFVQIKVYFDPTNRVPLIFELTGSNSLLFYNKFDGSWPPLFSINQNLVPALTFVHLKIVDSISIDNFANYTVGSVAVTVSRSQFSEKYVKNFHKPASDTKFSGILYRGYFIKGIGSINSFSSLTAYFVEGSHLALLIQVQSQGAVYTFAYDDNDVWNLVKSPADLSALLDQGYSKFARMFSKSK